MEKITVIAEEKDTGKVVKKVVFDNEKNASLYANSMLSIGYIVTLRWGMPPQKRKRR